MQHCITLLFLGLSTADALAATAITRGLRPRATPRASAGPCFTSPPRVVALTDRSQPSRLFPSPGLRVAATVLLGSLVPLNAALAVATTTGGTFGSVSTSSWLLFKVNQTLLKRAGWAVLVAALGFVALGGLLYKLTSEATIGEGTFRAYSLLNNVPGADATSDDTPLARLVSNVRCCMPGRTARRASACTLTLTSPSPSPSPPRCCT